MPESFPFLRRGTTANASEVAAADTGTSAAARQRGLAVLGGCAVAVAALTAGGVLLLSGEPDDTVIETVAVAAPAPRSSAAAAPAASSGPAYAPGSGVSVPLTGGPAGPGGTFVGPQVRPVAALGAGPGAPPPASPTATPVPEPLTTPRNPFANGASTVPGAGAATVAPTPGPGTLLSFPPAATPFVPEPPVAPVDVIPLDGGLPTLPTLPAAPLPLPPAPAPAPTATQVAPRPPAAEPTRLLLQRVTSEPDELVAQFLLDGARVRVDVGDTFGPAGRIRLVSLVQGTRATDWTAVLQVRGGQPFDAVTGRAVLLD